MRTRKTWWSVAALSCVLLVAGCCGPALADEVAPVAGDAEEQARALVEEVLRNARGGGAGVVGGDGLGVWSRSVIDRALARGRDAAAVAAGAPLPAGQNAGSIAPGRPNTAEVIVFTSLSLPDAIWRQWSREAARAGAAMVLRGIGEEGFRATARRIAARLPEGGVGVAVDPRLFRLFGIRAVPAVVVVPGGAQACVSRGCADDPPPPHDLIGGNIGLEAALEAIAREGEAGRAAARRHLAVMRGEQR